MTQTKTPTPIDYAAIEREAHRLRLQEIGRISNLVASAIGGAAARIADKARRSVRRIVQVH